MLVAKGWSRNLSALHKAKAVLDMLVPGLENVTLPALKAKISFVILTIGQTFFSQGLSSDPGLSCAVDSLKADSVVFSIQLENAHSPAMADFASSSIPLTVSFSCTIKDAKSSEAIQTFRLTHRAQMDLEKGGILVSRSYDGSLFRANVVDSCWPSFFRVPRIAVWATPLEEKEFRLSVGARLEKVYVKSLEQWFDPGLFWRSSDLCGQSSPVIYTRYRPPQPRFKKGKT